MDGLNYLHLYYFWVSAHERGFLKASKKLEMSQSTISTQIQNLEKQLGRKLIKRGPRIFELTEEGRVTFDHCQLIFKSGGELLASLKGERPVKNSILRIGIEIGIPKEMKKVFLQSLTGTEDVTLRTEFGSIEGLVRNLENRQVDVVFGNTRPSPNAGSRLKIRTLITSSALLVGRKKWQRKKGTGSSKGRPLFLPLAGSNARTSFEGWRDRNPEDQIQLESTDWGLLKSFALEGQGASLVPKFFVLNELKSGALIQLHEFKDVSEGLYAITREQDDKADWQKALSKKSALLF